MVLRREEVRGRRERAWRLCGAAVAGEREEEREEEEKREGEATPLFFSRLDVQGHVGAALHGVHVVVAVFCVVVYAVAAHLLAVHYRVC